MLKPRSGYCLCIDHGSMGMLRKPSGQPRPRSNDLKAALDLKLPGVTIGFC